MARKAKAKRGSFLSFVYILLLFLALAFVSFCRFYTGSFALPYQKEAVSFLIDNFSFFPVNSPNVLVDLIAFLSIEFVLSLAFRGRKPYSFLILIFLYVPYFIVLGLFHLSQGIMTPEILMERISPDENISLIILAISSVLIVLSLFPLLAPADRKWREKRKEKLARLEGDAQKEETENVETFSTRPETVENEEESSSGNLDNPLMKEMAKEEKKAEKKRKKEEKRRKKRDEKDEIVESFNTNDEPEMAPVVSKKYSSDDPLDFPSVSDIPHFSTIEPHEDLKKVTDDPETSFKRSMELDQFDDGESYKEELGPDWEDEKPKKEKKVRLENAPTHFKSGGILEATIESLKEIGSDDGQKKKQVPVPKPEKVKNEEAEDDSLAPSNLSKDHPRYKLFESLRKKKEPKIEEEKVEEKPLPPEDDEIIEIEEQKTEEENPYRAALEKLESEKSAKKENEKTPLKAEDIPSLDEKHKGKYKGADEEEIAEQRDSFYHTVGISGLMSNEKGMRGIKERSRMRYNPPLKDFLKEYPKEAYQIDAETRARGELIIETLSQFNVEVELDDIIKGPTVTMYEYRLKEGVAVQKVKTRVDDISYALGERHIRLLAPVPGKRAVGIEVPNFKRSVVGFKEMLESFENDREISKKYAVPMVLGKTITGSPVSIDVAAAPHLLIAGSTGSGKSVGINCLIATILYERSPNEVRLIMVDPKVVELKIYNGIPHLLTPVITDQKDVKNILKWLVDEMSRRYDMVSGMNVRSLKAYNEKIREEHIAAEKLPYIVLIMDEYADLMATIGKDIETYVGRLTAMARAVGIHIVLATQRPSTDVITGTIKNNITSRIAFAVSSYIDSRTILDEVGAENLLGRGDMFLKVPTSPGMERIQGAFISDAEVEKMVADLKEKYGEPDYLDPEIFNAYQESESDEDEGSYSDDATYDSEEEEYEMAKQILFEKKSISASYLQRRMRIGYNKAARFIDDMEKEGLISEANGSKPRVLIKMP